MSRSGSLACPPGDSASSWASRKRESNLSMNQSPSVPKDDEKEVVVERSEVGVPPANRKQCSHEKTVKRTPSKAFERDRVHLSSRWEARDFFL